MLCIILGPAMCGAFLRMTVVKERPRDESHPPQSLLSFWLMIRQNSFRCGPPSPAERAHCGRFLWITKHDGCV